MERFLKAWLPVIALCAVIFLLSQDSNSGTHSDAVLGWLLGLFGLNTASLRDLLDPIFRKSAHVFIYFCLSGLTYRGFAMGHPRWAWSAAARSLIFTILYAASDEYHQAFVYGRGPEVSDVFLDTGGALVCLFLVWLWMRSRSIRDEPRSESRRPSTASTW